MATNHSPAVSLARVSPAQLGMAQPIPARVVFRKGATAALPRPTVVLQAASLAVLPAERVVTEPVATRTPVLRARALEGQLLEGKGPRRRGAVALAVSGAPRGTRPAAGKRELETVAGVPWAEARVPTRGARTKAALLGAAGSLQSCLPIRRAWRHPSIRR